VYRVCHGFNVVEHFVVDVVDVNVAAYVVVVDDVVVDIVVESEFMFLREHSLGSE
jgi:hypothetical protein